MDTTALCDADKSIRVLAPEIACRSANPVLAGPAFTVRCREDFFAVARAIEEAAPGDVLVVDGGGSRTALAGEIFARAALARGIAGIVVDGGYRDIGYVATSPLPVYSRHVHPMAGTTAKLGELRIPVSCGGVTVNTGDIIVGDHEGVVVLDPARVGELLDRAEAVKATEARLTERLTAGAPLSSLVNLAEHADRLRAGEPSTLRFTV